MSAFAMAVFFKGMTPVETAALTRAMMESGDCFTYPAGHPPVVDKHSTGGIGDKVSLVLAPLVACTGCWVPMVSGRGLGITGGTLDKLESIPGFNVHLGLDQAVAQLERIGVVMMGQTDRFCPADKKLYALRDVTGTVPSIAADHRLDHVQETGGIARSPGAGCEIRQRSVHADASRMPKRSPPA